jgi:hypothetical protein
MSIKIIDDSSEEPPHLVVLDENTGKFMRVKISSPEENFERGVRRGYKSPSKNPFMIFRHDVIDKWNTAKKNKKFRKYPASFKDISLLWRNLPPNIIDMYEQIYLDYKELIPKFNEFVSYTPQENTAVSATEVGVENGHEFINDAENLIEESQYIDITFDNATAIFEGDENFPGNLGMFFFPVIKTYFANNFYLVRFNLKISIIPIISIIQLT